MSIPKRILKVSDGTVLEEDTDIDAFLAELNDRPKRDVKSLLQGIEIRPDMLQPYQLKLLGILEFPEHIIRGKVFGNPLLEGADLKLDIDGGPKNRLSARWHNYHFLLPIPNGEPIIIEAQLSVFTPDWVDKWRDWLPLVDEMIKSEKHAHELAQLQQRRAELYEELKKKVVQHLENLRDS